VVRKLLKYFVAVLSRKHFFCDVQKNNETKNQSVVVVAAPQVDEKFAVVMELPTEIIAFGKLSTA